jgi:hypothetical protein
MIAAAARKCEKHFLVRKQSAKPAIGLGLPGLGALKDGADLAMVSEKLSGA